MNRLIAFLWLSSFRDHPKPKRANRLLKCLLLQTRRGRFYQVKRLTHDEDFRPSISSLWGGLSLLECGCMSASDTVKDVVRIVTTGGHAKDVIDPLQTKLSLLTEQVAALEKENRNLKTENDNLKTQLQNARPKSEELSQKTEDILKAFFNRADEFSLQDIARLFRMQH
jgi:regulator of replication initiation timing